MRFLTAEECRDWCERHDFPVRKSSSGVPRPDLHSSLDFLALDHSPDSGVKVALSRNVVDQALQYGPTLVWVTEWSVWPSSEHLALFARLRAALGERRKLIDVPGHVIDQADRDDGISVLLLALIFSWDCYVFSSKDAPVFFTSHDEVTGFFIPATGSMAELKGRFAKWSERK